MRAREASTGLEALNSAPHVPAVSATAAALPGHMELRLRQERAASWLRLRSAKGLRFLDFPSLPRSKARAGRLLRVGVRTVRIHDS